MNIVRKEKIGPWEIRAVARITGHYMIVQHERGPQFLFLKFLAVNFDQSMRLMDLFIQTRQAEIECDKEQVA